MVRLVIDAGDSPVIVDLAEWERLCAFVREWNRSKGIRVEGPERPPETETIDIRF